MVVSLFGTLHDYASLLQQIVRDGGRMDQMVVVEIYLDELAEPRRVLVPHSLRISKGLQYRVGIEDFIFDILLNMGSYVTLGLREFLLLNTRQISQYNFGRFSLSSSALTSDDNALVFLLKDHGLISLLCHLEKVGWRSFLLN